MNKRWTRPYSAGPYRLLVLALLLVGLTILVFATVGILGGRGDKLFSLAVVWAFILTWLGLGMRFSQLGVYVSADGVRVVNFLRTAVLPWEEVERFYLGPSKAPGFGVWPSRATAVWIKPYDGSPIQTVLNSQSADFLGRRHAFTRAYKQLRRQQQIASGSDALAPTDVSEASR